MNLTLALLAVIVFKHDYVVKRLAVIWKFKLPIEPNDRDCPAFIFQSVLHKYRFIVFYLIFFFFLKRYNLQNSVCTNQFSWVIAWKLFNNIKKNRQKIDQDIIDFFYVRSFTNLSRLFDGNISKLGSKFLMIAFFFLEMDVGRILTSMSFIHNIRKTKNLLNKCQ